jgi:hypothetical protein
VPDSFSPFQRSARGRSRRIVIPKKPAKKFQSTTFNQHEKPRFNIQKLKSWLNKLACVRVFFETRYKEKRAFAGLKNKAPTIS